MTVDQEGTDKIALALSKVQASIQPAKANQKNPYFNSTYADLASCWGAIREPMAAEGLSVTQTFSPGPNGEVMINSILMHSSGQKIYSTLPVKPAKPDPQSLGSAITYGRRYALMALVGISTNDDDGNAASGLPEKKEERNWPTPPKVSPPTNPYKKQDGDAKKGFDPANKKHTEAIEKVLQEKGVPSNLWEQIYQAMKGKNSTYLPEAIDEVYNATKS